MRQLTKVGTKVLAVTVLFASLLGQNPAEAKNPAFIVDEITWLGRFAGRPYIKVEGVFVGIVNRDDGTTGLYRTPFRAVVPQRDANGIAVLTPVNNAVFLTTLRLSGLGDTTAMMTGDYLHGSGIFTDEFLLRHGYTYMAFGWNKFVTDTFGPNPPPGEDRALAYGTIERGSDGNEIIKDAARIIREIQPWKRFAVSTVLGVGHSQTGIRLSGFIRAGGNRADGKLLYDGFLTSGNGGRCSEMTDVSPLYTVTAQCFGPTPEDQGKVIAVQTETDPFTFRGGTVRADTSTYRVYEYAGTSHIPLDYFPLAPEFPNATRQNPADTAPGYRAAIANLVSWVVDGVEPPGSVYLEGTVGEDFRVTIARDADGNALGGVRMPHMPRVIDGKPAGAPLGEYNGTETRAPLEPFVVYGGYFEPFSAAQLQARYGTRAEYVDRVRRSAKELVESRFILKEDYWEYVMEALYQPLW